MAETDIKTIEYTIPAGGWIGVVSDTHVPQRAGCIPPQLFKLLDGASLILHAGDLARESVLEEFKAIAPVEAVGGNMDSSSLHNKLGRQKIVKVNGMYIGLMHGRGRTREAAMQAYQAFAGRGVEVDGVVFGHTHFPIQDYHQGVLLFNPGSPVEPRGGSSPACGKMWLAEKTLQAQIIYL